MGIYYNGGMLVGALGSELSIPEEIEEEHDVDLGEYLESFDMESWSLHYDADSDCRYYGWSVEDVAIEDMDAEWLADIKALGDKFTEITGVRAYLIGTQDIY